MTALGRTLSTALSTPLGRVRSVATLAALITGAACLPLMDSTLPAGRLVPAYLAVVLILLDAVLVFVRERVGWWSTLLCAPLVAVASLGLADKPDTVALALSVLASRTLYGSTGMAVVRTALLAAVAPTLIGVMAAVDGTRQPVSTAAVPVVVLVLFSAVLRMLYSAMRAHQVAAERERLMATMSRALLESVDLAEAEAVARSTLLLLAQGTDGLDVKISAPSSGHLPAPGALTFETTGEEVVVGGPAAERLEIRRFVDSLGSQLALVRATRAAHRDLYTMAHHDMLTSLCNRRTFFAALANHFDDDVALHSVAVMLIDLDEFKAVNDAHGHAAGDVVLVEVAQRMRDVCGDGATVARFGGDEFAVLAPDVGPVELERLADEVRRSIGRPIDWDGELVQVGASIGIANAEPGQAAGDLMRVADLAMYEAKALGKNQVVRHQTLPAESSDGPAAVAAVPVP